tara:strand:+ start:811 stop:1056 length:246 start_codon:yes stop_codon:yes gene_type:complete
MNKTSIIAICLLLATIASWLTFEEFHGHTIASVTIVLISTVKVKAIMNAFMEVDHLNGPWKYMLNGWLAVVCLSMIFAEVI